MAAREKAGREASPTAGVIDSQSVKDDGKRRAARLRRGQEDQGPQAPYRHRHARQPGRSRRPCGRHPGPRRRAARSRSIRALYPWLRHVFADGGYAGDKLRAALKGIGIVDAGNHQALRRSKGLRGPAAPLGRRTDLRLARPLPPPRQGLRSHNRQRRRMGLRRTCPKRKNAGHARACRGRDKPGLDCGRKSNGIAGGGACR